MKWCENCNGERKSWYEVKGSGYSDSQCWSCDKNTLTSSRPNALTRPNQQTALSAVASNASSTVKEFVREGQRNNSSQGDCLIIQGDQGTGSWSYERLTYDNRTFRYHNQNYDN